MCSIAPSGGVVCAIMFSCLDCRKALIAKSKSHSEISYDGGKFRDDQNKYSPKPPVPQQQQQKQLTGYNNDTSVPVEGQQGRQQQPRDQDDDDDDEEQDEEDTYPVLRRSQTQVRGSGIQLRRCSTTKDVGIIVLIVLLC